MVQNKKFDMGELLPEFGMTRKELAEHLRPAINDLKAGRSKTSEELREKFRRQRNEPSRNRQEPRHESD